MLQNKRQTFERQRLRVDRWGTILLGGLIVGLTVQGLIAIRSRQPQALPVTAQLQAANQTIDLEVAQTDQQKQIGLMHRSALPIDHGMLFIVDPPQRVETWMRNVTFDVDVVFLKNGRIESFAFGVPCRSQRCPIYRSKGEVDRVLELAGGQVAALGLKVGDQLEIQSLP